MDKSPDAFRTISEVADDLETPAHVLRFWESRFPQIRPVKRAGGRRYYRPADVALLTGIKRLLHDEGLTIRGVQKILREQGVRHVAGLSGELVPDDVDIDAEAALEAALASNFGLRDEADMPPEKATTATIVALEFALRNPAPAPVSEPEPSFNFADLVEDSAGPVVLDAAKTDLPETDLPEIELVEAEPETAEIVAIPRPALAESPKAPAQPKLAADAPLIDRLRALPPHAFHDRQSDLHHLRARLLYLRNRMQAAPKGPLHSPAT
ncbi:MerR family transcriptional regulator [Cypionkella aquatica]|uniref:MerR family transcriptional regulator n=1 Tax=Cypionkella aquatica TaxID=1756042 RepID=A0AA37TWJ0_9RHOB|nr:MerR family transcriptional regulator [Cypionkella aquatica]GLS85036.1 MerR family transcriptional regulator [Cypionkella aquatica]